MQKEYLLHAGGGAIMRGVVRMRCINCNAVQDISIDGTEAVCTKCATYMPLHSLLYSDGTPAHVGPPPGTGARDLRMDPAALKRLKALPVDKIINTLSAAKARDMEDEKFLDSLARGAEDDEIARLFSEVSQDVLAGKGLAPDEMMRALRSFEPTPVPVKVNLMEGRTPEEHVKLFGQPHWIPEEDPTVTKKLSLAELAEMAGD